MVITACVARHVQASRSSTMQFCAIVWEDIIEPKWQKVFSTYRFRLTANECGFGVFSEFRLRSTVVPFLPTCTTCSYGPVFVCLCLSTVSVSCQNVWMDRAGFWCGGFLCPILHCISRNSGVLQKEYFPQELYPKISGLGENLMLSQSVVSLARQRWRMLTAINWTIIGQLTWQYLQRSMASLSHWSSTSVYSTIPSRIFMCDRL